MRNFIRRHQLADPFFLFFATYMSILTVTGCYIMAFPEVLK